MLAAVKAQQLEDGTPTERGCGADRSVESAAYQQGPFNPMMGIQPVSEQCLDIASALPCVLSMSSDGRASYGLDTPGSLFANRTAYISCTKIGSSTAVERTLSKTRADGLLWTRHRTDA